jgi:ankyrin repeat protein
MVTPNGNDRRGRVQQITQEGSLLCQLAREGNIDLIRRSVHEQGWDINAKGLNEQTALMTACSKGNIALVKDLLNLGANPAAQDIDDRPCLTYAVTSKVRLGKIEKLLLDAGADMFAADHRGNTALSTADYLDNLLASETLRHYAKMPAYDAEAAISREMLTNGQDGKHAPLESPSYWHNWPEVAEKLAEQGEQFGKEDFLADDARYLTRAIECRAAEAVFDHMAAQGETMQFADMMPQGKIAPWVQAMADVGQLGSMMREDMWKECSVEQLQQFHKALPAEARAQITNYYQLNARLQQQESRGIGR